MKKPDRWDRMILKELNDTCADIPSKEPCLSREQVVKLLRQQHNRTLRLVRKVWGWQAEQLADNEDACEVIINELKKHAR